MKPIRVAMLALLIVAPSVRIAGAAAVVEAAATSHRLHDHVGIARFGRFIVLATLNRPDFRPERKHGQWRFRLIRIPTGVPYPTSSRISRNATGLELVFAGCTKGYDLATPLEYSAFGELTPLEMLDEASTGACQGVLGPRERSPLVQGGRRRRFEEEKFDEPSPAANSMIDKSKLDAEAGRAIRHLANEDYPGRRADASWEFYAVEPNVALYAPIVQLRPLDAMPSSFDIWEEYKAADITVASADKETRIRRAFEGYWLLPSGSRRCVIYYRVPDRPLGVGTWLIEYWFYYPFDAGAYEDHIHDSEHLFVEVDRLGGTVRQVIGDAHGPWTTNNIYQAFRKNSLPVRLPLHALVEFRKHATSPDINGDGRFSPGVDINQYLDQAKIWGIRDMIGATDANLRSYSAWMTIERRPQDAHAPTTTMGLFGKDPAGMEPLGCDCDLEQAPESNGAVLRASCKPASDEANTRCATAKVVDHDDWKDPARVLKAGAFPPFSIRFGGAVHPAPSSGDNYFRSGFTLYGGVGVDVAKATFGILPAPGRLTADVLLRSGPRFRWRDHKEPPRDGPEPVAAEGNRELFVTHMGFGFAGLVLRYERPWTHMFGTYVGLSWLKDLRGPDDEGIRSAWLDSGLTFEKLLTKGLQLQAGAGITFDTFYGLDFDWRLGLARRLGSPKYGARHKN